LASLDLNGVPDRITEDIFFGLFSARLRECRHLFGCELSIHESVERISAR